MRNNKHIFIFPIALLAAMLLMVVYCPPIFSQVNTGIETKISIETNLEERLRKVLTEICGTDKLIVIVNTELYGEKEKSEQIKLKEKEKRPKVVLPGVPFKENIAERKIEDLLAPLDIGKTKTLIKKISATVIIDKSVSVGVVEIAKKITVGLLGLDFERGDKLTFERMNFQKNPFYWVSLFKPPYVFWLIGIILVAIFVGGAMFSLFNPFKKYSGSFVDTISRYVTHQVETAPSSDSMWQQGTAREPNFAQPLGAVAPAAQPLTQQSQESQPFSFLRPEHLNRLSVILKDETPENIAIVLNYLDDASASRIFVSLDHEKQSEVTSNLASSRQVSQEKVKQLEQRIRNAIDYFLGGEEKLTILLDYADKETQEKVVQDIKSRDQALASRLEQSLFTFEDIAIFSSQTINTIVRRCNVTVFAQLIKTMADEFKNKILESLPAVARRRLEQEIELGRQIPESRIREEKARIIDLVRRLQQEGMIQITGREFRNK